MEWYEIIIMIVVVIAGIYVKGTLQDHKNNYHRGKNWRDKK